MNLIRIVFWSVVSVLFILIVARFALGFLQRFNLTAGVAGGVERAAGLAS